MAEKKKWFKIISIAIVILIGFCVLGARQKSDLSRYFSGCELVKKPVFEYNEITITPQRWITESDEYDYPWGVVGVEFCDLIIYGHSHQYEEVRDGGRILLNPGSCGPKRFRLPITMALIEIQDGKCRINKVELKNQLFKT